MGGGGGSPPAVEPLPAEDPAVKAARETEQQKAQAAADKATQTQMLEETNARNSMLGRNSMLTRGAAGFPTQQARSMLGGYR